MISLRPHSVIKLVTEIRGERDSLGKSYLTDVHFSSLFGQVYLGRRGPVFGMGRLEHVGWFLLLLRLFVDYRFWRYRPGRQDLLRARPRNVFHLLFHVPDAR